MKSIDGKSVVIGLLMSVCVLLLMGQTGGGVSYGKFQLALGGEANTISYIMDTDTGELWSRQVSGYKYFGTPHNPKYERKTLKKKKSESKSKAVQEMKTVK